MGATLREQRDDAVSKPRGSPLGKLVLLGSINSYPRSRIDHFCTCQWSLLLLGQLRAQGILDAAEVWFASDEAFEFEKYGVQVRCFNGFDEMAQASCPTDVLWVRGISKPFVKTLNRMPARLRVYYAASKRLLPYRWKSFDVILVDDQRQIGPVTRFGMAGLVDRIIKTTDPTIFRPLPDVAKLYDLCMIGEMRAPRKNFAALVRLLTKAPQLSALVIGEQTAQVMSQLSETGARVEFVDFCPRDELNLLMNQTRIGFVPNQLDAAPRVIQEFMAAGVPVLLNAAILGGRDYITTQTGVLAAEDGFPDAIRSILSGGLPLDPRAGFMAHFRPERAASHFASVLFRAMRECGRQSPGMPPGFVRRFYTRPWRARTALARCLDELAADNGTSSKTHEYAHHATEPPETQVREVHVRIPHHTPRVLLIGVGRWGANHLRVWQKLAAELYVAEAASEQREACRRAGVPADRVVGDYAAALDRVDLVDIVTPVDSHFAIARAAMQAGKDVFVEKPLASTSHQAIELDRLARERARILQVGHIFRFDPATEFIRGVLARGELGTVRWLHSRFAGFKRPRADCGVTAADSLHFIDLFNTLLGAMPRAVSACMTDFLGRARDDFSWMALDYGGVLGFVEANYFTPDKDRKLTIVGAAATLVCDFAAKQERIRIYRNRHVPDGGAWQAIEGEVTRHDVAAEEPLTRELRAFVDSSVTRREAAADGRAGYEVIQIIEAAQQSSELGQAISLIERTPDATRATFEGVHFRRDKAKRAVGHRLGAIHTRSAVRGV